MITAEQMEKGLFQYFEKEIFSPVGGGILTEKGIMKNNMVDIDRLCIELKKSFSKTGTMTVNFPIVGDIRFSVDDIDTLKDYVISNK